MESVFRIKRALVEVALESRILVMDFSKSNSEGGAGSDIRIEEADMPAEKVQRNKLIKCQRRLRDLFSEFLLLVSLVLKMPQKENTLKLLNEVFVFDEVW